MGEDSPAMIRRKTLIAMQLLVSMEEDVDSPCVNERLIPKCLAVIRRSIADPNFGIQDLCDRFSVSRATLTRQFRKETHMSPGRFILNEKMAKAVALLSGTDLSIESIARQCGFHDRATFTRFIHRGKGMNPSEFRKQCGQGTLR
ncbi:HTH-type transcriptional activator RhaR [bioreactor metagenome]|uniref:HTH-type transcriptional activator RhaR n=1 Tax=bioreactor metagenome TaxID=1076179 RepID=A0A645GYF8_9ZZZZ